MDYLETAVAYRAIENLKTLIGNGPTPALQAKAFLRQTIVRGLSMREEDAQARWGDDGPAIAAQAIKAAVAAITQAEADPAASAFLGLAVERSVLGRLRVRRPPFDTRTTKVVSGSRGYWSGEGKPIPLSRPALEGETLRPLSVNAIIVATQESLRNPAGEALLQDDLLNAVAGAIDEALVSADPGVADERPAGIAHGAPSIVATGDLADDLAALFQLFTGDLTTASFVTTPAVALRLALAAGGNPQIALGPNGGQLFGVPTLTTRHMAATSNGTPLLLVDGAGISANWTGIEIARSAQATLVMSDTPTAEAAQVSMFQTNSVALKASARATWNVSREGAVAVLEGV